jgi:arginyl-tRNA synthetase
MKQVIKNIVNDSIKKLQEKKSWDNFDMPDFTIERPKNFSHGDWMTNVAFLLAKEIDKLPVDIANELVKIINEEPNELIDECSVAAPGFINIKVSCIYLHKIVDQIVELGTAFGNNGSKAGTIINNEFISANPTGPLHLGNGRGGFLGDVLGRILQKNGAKVVNEYYINDAGEQIIKLGHSVLKDDDAVYTGEYIDILHSEIIKTDMLNEKSVKNVGQWAANYIIEEYLKHFTKDLMHINFDSWISEEKDIIEKGYVQKAIKKLSDDGLTFEKDGALWLATTKFGDDKDRVLIKKDGQKTYFASDCGYILNKISRGFNNIIEIWGADHHGYILRFKAAARALGFVGDMKFIIVQMVRLVQNGKEVRMSKRAGNVVYIDELIKEVGHDVTRFFFLMQSADSHMDFDLALAKEQSNKNPVFYVQYAHARLISLMEKSLELSFTHKQIKGCNTELLVHEKERALMRELEMFSEVIEDISNTYQVHQLPHYSIKLAEKFHAFYSECRIVDEENVTLSIARLKLVQATRIVIAQTLEIIGVEPSKKM